MKIKKSYIKKKYNLQNTGVLFYFSNNGCLKAEKTREFLRLCLIKHIKSSFLPSSFGYSLSPKSQGPSMNCVFAKNLGFSEIAFAGNLKEIPSCVNKEKNLFYGLKKENYESTNKYSQDLLDLLALKTQKV